MNRFHLLITLLFTALLVLLLALRAGNQNLQAQLSARPEPAATPDPVATIQPPPPVPVESAARPPVVALPEPAPPEAAEDLPPLVVPATIGDFGGLLGEVLAKSLAIDEHDEEAEIAFATEVMAQMAALNGAMQIHGEQLRTLEGDAELSAAIVTTGFDLNEATAARVGQIIVEEKQRAAELGLLEQSGFDPAAVEDLQLAQQAFDEQAHRRLLQSLPAEHHQALSELLESNPLRVPVATSFEKLTGGGL